MIALVRLLYDVLLANRLEVADANTGLQRQQTPWLEVGLVRVVTEIFDRLCCQASNELSCRCTLRSTNLSSLLRFVLARVVAKDTNFANDCRNLKAAFSCLCGSDRLLLLLISRTCTLSLEESAEEASFLSALDNILA